MGKTVRMILNEVQFGSEIMEADINKKNILEARDDELGFIVSKRIKKLASNLFLEDCAIAKPVQKMIVKFSAIESRLEDGKELSDSYKKMQALSLKEDFDNISFLISNRKEYNKIGDKKTLGKILAAVKLGVKNINEEVVLKDSENVLFNSYIKEEVTFLNDLL